LLTHESGACCLSALASVVPWDVDVMCKGKKLASLSDMQYACKGVSKCTYLNPKYSHDCRYLNKNVIAVIPNHQAGSGSTRPQLLIKTSVPRKAASLGNIVTHFSSKRNAAALMHYYASDCRPILENAC